MRRRLLRMGVSHHVDESLRLDQQSLDLGELRLRLLNTSAQFHHRCRLGHAGAAVPGGSVIVTASGAASVSFGERNTVAK